MNLQHKLRTLAHLLRIFVSLLYLKVYNKLQVIIYAPSYVNEHFLAILVVFGISKVFFVFLRSKGIKWIYLPLF